MNLPAKFYSEIFAQNPFKGYTLMHGTKDCDTSKNVFFLTFK